MGARSLVVVWDSGRTVLKGEGALEKCIHYAFERMEVHLSKRGARGLMVADRPGGGRKQEEDLLSDFLEKVQNGTEYVVPKSIALNVVTTPSHLVRHLQLADLVVGITTAMVAGQYEYARVPFEIIRSTFIQNYNGTAGATGLKLVPDDIINLYHWVLGEKTYWKVGRGVGFGIPEKRLPYASDEFKVGLS